MQERLIRERELHNILILEQGAELLVPAKPFLQRFGVDGVIRICESEYESIDRTRGYLGHFNLETAGHIVGLRYALPRIVRHGYYDHISGNEVLPLLSFDNTYTAVCEQYEEQIPYEKLTAEHFRYSHGEVHDVQSLKRVIVDRYTKSLPSISAEDILSRGVAYTLLRFV